MVENKNSRVLVIGAGLAGSEASLYLAKKGIEIYVCLGTLSLLTFLYLTHNSIPCVQQSTATAYGEPKKSAILSSNCFTVSKLILILTYIF